MNVPKLNELKYFLSECKEEMNTFIELTNEILADLDDAQRIQITRKILNRSSKKPT